MNKSKSKFRENKTSKLEKITGGLQKFGFKLGSNKVLCSIRDGFGVAGVPMMGMILPVIIATIFFNNATMLGKLDGIHDTAGMLWITDHIYPILMSTQQAATAAFSLLFLVCTAFFMSKNYVTKGSPLTATILAVACFFALAPFGLDWNGAITLMSSWTKGSSQSEPFSQINITNIGTNGLLPAMFVALTVPYLFGKMTSNSKLRIKLPETIPPAIADVLTNVISITILLASYTGLAWSYAYIAHAADIRIKSISMSQTMTDASDQTYIADTIFSLITNYVGAKLQSLATSPWFTGALTLLMTAFWIFGIHGTNLFSPIQVIIMMPCIITNIYFWTVYTNPTIQALIANSPGTSISDAYYNITGHLSQAYWDAYNIANDPDLANMVNSDGFQQIIALVKNGADMGSQQVIDQVTAFATDPDNLMQLMTYALNHGLDVNVDTFKNILVQALEGSAYTQVIDPVKGIYVSNLGQYYNSIQMIPLNGLDSVGGTGMTFGLTYSILLFSKFKPYREVAKLEAVPAIFGINEPIIFGLPVVLNFVIAIPFIFGATTLSIVAHYMVWWHMVRPLVGIPISFLPMMLLPYIMSGFDWRAIVIAGVFAVLSIGYYAVFLKASAKFTIKNTAKQMGVEIEEYIQQNKEELFVDKIYKKPVKKTSIEK